MSEDKPRQRGEEEQVLPPEMEVFLREVVDGSLLRYEVLRFFYQNPYAILTVSDLSIWVSREQRPLAEALQRLASMGYLMQSYASSAYVLSSERGRRQRLNHFFDYLEDNRQAAREIRARLRQSWEGD